MLIIKGTLAPLQDSGRNKRGIKSLAGRAYLLEFEDLHTLPFGKLPGLSTEAWGGNENLILNTDIVSLNIKVEHLVQFYRLFIYLNADTNAMDNNAFVLGCQNIKTVFGTRLAPFCGLFSNLITALLQKVDEAGFVLELKLQPAYFGFVKVIVVDIYLDDFILAFY